MNVITAIMGVMDLICALIIIINFDLALWSLILAGIMAIKGGVSFL